MIGRMLERISYLENDIFRSYLNEEEQESLKRPMRMQTVIFRHAEFSRFRNFEGCLNDKSSEICKKLE